MQWILQDFEDGYKIKEILDRMEINNSMHKVVPFIGELLPDPIIKDASEIVMFGSYSLRHYARRHNLTPGVFEIRPYIYEIPWQPYMLNSLMNMLIFPLNQMLEHVDLESSYFIRPVEDSKEIAGNVMNGPDIERMVKNVLALDEYELVTGSLTHDTVMMFGEPQKITREWRLWVINNKIVTGSLYKEGSRVIYKPEVDYSVLEFARMVIELNPDYSPAYVLDICRTRDSYRILETNCINAAGFYAGDLQKIIMAIEDLKI